MKLGWTGNITHSPKETIELGTRLTSVMEPGDVFCLNGDLAAGKTTFMKGVLKGLHYNQEVTSPTFTLINEYDSEPPVIHIDCYREHDLNRWQNLGLQEYFEGERIVFIEWANYIKRLLPENAKTISFSHIDENVRKIEFMDQ